MDLEHPRDIRISCAPALAPWLEAELAKLELPVVARTRTSVSVRGGWRDTWRLCLELRTAFQVLFPLARFPCGGPDELYAAVRGMAWEDVVPPDGYLTVESRVDHPSIDNSMFPNLRVKDAICDRLVAATGRRPDSGAERRGVVVHLAWLRGEATISLNAAGRKLADRGYRRNPHRAPLQETLAAGIILATGWEGTTPLVVPMCGSGTLAIEAAMIGLDRAPGLLRPTFAFSHVKGFDAGVFKGLRAATRRRAAKTLRAPIIATDLDPEAIEAARRNVETAGLASLIDFRVCDFADTPLPDEAGVLIVNPEYGSRLGSEATLAPVYERLGAFFKHRCDGWSCFVLSGNRTLTGHLGLRATRRVPFFNADIECRLLEYRMWRA
ncbi:MAG: class I SAM-dependent RNA methyltransferase, partial [Phycisphaerae bacterium]|nr:class I SAM-dependent RNA methyltransferase [Phycisphaerae bacterium]